MEREAVNSFNLASVGYNPDGDAGGRVRQDREAVRRLLARKLKYQARSEISNDRRPLPTFVKGHRLF